MPRNIWSLRFWVFLQSQKKITEITYIARLKIGAITTTSYKRIKLSETHKLISCICIKFWLGFDCESLQSRKLDLWGFGCFFNSPDEKGTNTVTETPTQPDWKKKKRGSSSSQLLISISNSPIPTTLKINKNEVPSRLSAQKTPKYLSMRHGISKPRNLEVEDG